MWATQYQLLLASRLREDPSAAKQITASNAPRPLYPSAVEAAYKNWIARQLRPLIRFAELGLRDRVEGWAAPYRADAQDSFGVGFGRFVRELLDKQQELFNSDPARRNLVAGILGFGERTNKFNYKDFQKQITFALGNPFHPDEPWVKSVLKDWSEANYKLITNLSDTYITRINQIISEMVPSGATWKQIAGRLQAVSSTITGARAKLIARDQVGKLNGQLLQRRHTEAGIETYEWLTSADERVRGRPGGKYPTATPSHWIMDDKVCRWDNPGVWKSGDDWVPRSSNASMTHPGQDIQCRCVAVPNYDDLVAQAQTIAKDPSLVAPVAPPPAPVPPPAPKVNDFDELPGNPDALPEFRMPRWAIENKHPDRTDSLYPNGSNNWTEDWNDRSWVNAPGWLTSLALKTPATKDTSPRAVNAAPDTAWARVDIAQIHMGKAYSEAVINDRGIWRHELGHVIDYQIARSKSGKDKFDSARILKENEKERKSLSRKPSDALEAQILRNSKMFGATATLRANDLIREMDLDWDGFRGWLETSGGMVQPSKADALNILEAMRGRNLRAFIRELWGDPFGSPEEQTRYSLAVARMDLSRMNLVNFSDFFGSATVNQVLGMSKKSIGWGGHSTPYYKLGGKHDYDAMGTEMFANFVALEGDADKTWSKLLHIFAPNIYTKFKQSALEHLQAKDPRP